MMAAAPTIHPEATAANDFLTVLLHHSGMYFNFQKIINKSR